MENSLLSHGILSHRHAALAYRWEQRRIGRVCARRTTVSWARGQAPAASAHVKGISRKDKGGRGC